MDWADVQNYANKTPFLNINQITNIYSLTNGKSMTSENDESCVFTYQMMDEFIYETVKIIFLNHFFFICLAHN